MPERYQPFSCGTQGGDWRSANCDRCTKSWENNGGPEGSNAHGPCEIDNALADAFMDDGSVSENIARRMGYLDHKGRFQWMCPEVEWTPEWIAESERRKAAQS